MIHPETFFILSKAMIRKSYKSCNTGNLPALCANYIKNICKSRQIPFSTGLLIMNHGPEFQSLTLKQCSPHSNAKDIPQNLKKKSAMQRLFKHFEFVSPGMATILNMDSRRNKIRHGEKVIETKIWSLHRYLTSKKTSLQNGGKYLYESSDPFLFSDQKNNGNKKVNRCSGERKLKSHCSPLRKPSVYGANLVFFLVTK